MYRILNLLLSGVKKHKMIFARLTLSELNDVIGKEFPNIEVVAGGGYYYLYSDDAETRFILSGLTSGVGIYEYKVSNLTIAQWKVVIGKILCDNNPYLKPDADTTAPYGLD